jgi:diguanylate cyclase (GGDEF)-like protein
LALDIDNFSKVTRDFSVETADSALIEIARFFKRVIAQQGYVTRYYGDVFLIYLRDHARDEAAMAARKLLELLKAKNFFIDDKHVLFAGKIGIALYPENGISGNELIKRSFGALKEARGGGVAVAFYDERKNLSR